MKIWDYRDVTIVAALPEPHLLLSIRMMNVSFKYPASAGFLFLLASFSWDLPNSAVMVLATLERCYHLRG